MPEKITQKSLNEEIVELFGPDATDEFKSRVTTVFEAAVNAKADQIKEEMEKAVDAEVEKRLQESVEEIETKVDRYLSYVCEEWLKANELAIESSLKVQMAESILEGVNALISDHGFSVPEGGEKVIEELVSKNEELQDKLNEATQRLLEMDEAIEEMELEEAVIEASDGLTDVQVEKLKTLSEGIRYKDVADFKAKVVTIRESLFDKPAKEVGKDAVNDTVVETVPEKKHSPLMEAYLKTARNLS